MKEYRIAAIPADGIGTEVIAAGLEVLDALAKADGGFKLKVEHFDWGSDYYKKHGVMMPADGRETLKKFDAIYFGAVGAPDVPDHITLWGLRINICQPFDQYANVRPTRILPGIKSPLAGIKPEDLDWVIVRENSEGEYSGHGGRSHRGLPEEVATEVSIFTRAGVTRIMRFAFKLAQSRPRKLLTVVTKSNAQRNGLVLWDEIAAAVAKEFPDVTWDKMLVDAMTVRMTLKPQTIDTIVAPPARRHPVGLGRRAGRLTRHRADRQPQSRAPVPLDVRADPRLGLRHRGQGIANPIATFWTACMMLDHLGEKAASDRLMAAIERVTADPKLHTPDLGGKATSRMVTDAVIATLEVEKGGAAPSPAFAS